ncbi:MAG: DUF4919 domain-containing protein [Bacteroidaceae bacterium]|nr:DUF4919 domain-containing protein [Bacteroidaceae bacterium]
MRKLFIISVLIVTASFVKAQLLLDKATIEDIVKNENSYFNDIVQVFNSDDPFLDTDDIALVYYGQAFTPGYKPGKDENEKLMKKYYNEDNYPKVYETAKKILAYSPANLDALFYAWISAKTIGKSEDEYLSYVNKHQNIINMIKSYGDGKSSKTAFRIVNPEDQKYVMYSLNIDSELSHELDTETLCNILIVNPTPEFQARRMYFDISLFLNNSNK